MNFVRSLYKLVHPKFKTIFLEYEVDRDRFYGRGMPVHAQLANIISSRQEEYKTILTQCTKYAAKFTEIRYRNSGADTTEPVWHNKYITAFDLVMLYTIVSTIHPSQYFEIGSGTSTKMASKAIHDNNLSTKIISFDPNPRREVGSIVDEQVRKNFGRTESEQLVQGAQENDIIFMDGSHRMLSNSDCMFFFLEVLPNLRKGTLVHFHDIYLPFDYPLSARERYYSEQFCLAIALLENPDRYTVLLPNYYVSNTKSLKEILTPMWQQLPEKRIETHGCSFWLRIEK